MNFGKLSRVNNDYIMDTYLAVLAILDVFLSVEEPVRDFVLARVLHDGDNPLNLLRKHDHPTL